MGRIKTGRDIPCCVCGTLIYRSNAYLARGHRFNACRSPECKTAAFRGKNNPFWGRTHSDETVDKIRATKAANPTLGRTGPPKGYKHTPEAREKITARLRQRWIDNRDKMIAALPRGVEHHYHKEPELRRYRKNFTPLQRREWKDKHCAWCGVTERLNLDHIIPVFDGGQPERWNAQTLCHPCNLWKVKYVDRPRYHARLRGEQASDKSRGQT